MESIKNWLKSHLVCPRDHSELSIINNVIKCKKEHTYKMVDNIPIFLLDDYKETHGACHASLKEVEESRIGQNVEHVNSDIDPFVQNEIAATNGLLWKPLINRLTSYPIPEIPIPYSEKKYFLDIGCNWGRWCLSAAKKGYIPIGIDPSINAIRAARRIAKQLSINAYFIVGDARFLPFSNNSFDTIFSYSVLQHFSKDDLVLSLKEISRVLKASGFSLIQLAHKFGLWNLCNQLRKGLREQKSFDVRYWTLDELKEIFSTCIGPSGILCDAYLNLNPDIKNIELMPYYCKAVIIISEILRKASLKFPFLTNFADSVYITSKK